MPTELVGDSYTLSDAAAGTVPYFITFTDGITLSDTVVAVGRVILIPAQFGDRIFLSDAVDVEVDPGIRFGLGDSLNLVDSLKTSRTQNNNVSDTLSLTDSLAVNQFGGYNITGDAVSISDAAVATFASIFVTLTIAAGDSLVLSDSVGLTSPNVLFGDSLYLSDGILFNFGTVLNPYLRRYLNDVS